MFSRFRKKDEPEKRVCPFCEIENPLDAKSCTQCFFQFERASREQDEALSEHEEGTLLDELLNSQVEIEADETVPVDVITMDDMTVEVDQYDIVGDDIGDGEDFTYISSAGPTFAETEAESEGNIESQSTPTLATMPGMEVEQNSDFVGEVAEEIQIDDMEQEVDLLNLPQLPEVSSPPPIERDDEFFATAAEAAVISGEESESNLPSLPNEPDDGFEMVIDSAPLDEVELPMLPTIPDTEELAAPVIPESKVELPPTPVVEENSLPPTPVIVEESISPMEVENAVQPVAPSVVPNAAPPASVFAPVTHTNGGIWPWPMAEEWDYRDLYRELKEAMEAAQRGDHSSAATALDRLGPHLGQRIDLLYYVGQVLQILGRQEALTVMLATAQQAHPADQHVSSAVYHLGGMGQTDANNS